MGTKPEKILHNCLYFTANSLARQVSHLAEEEFRYTGLSPSHAFLLMLVIKQPGITPKELSESPAPGTVHGDAIRGCADPEARDWWSAAPRVNRPGYTPPTRGGTCGNQISKCWQNLYHRYSKILGEEEGIRLTAEIDKADEKLKG